MLVRQILNTPGRAIPLRRLFALKDYPSDVMALYAEGYSVANFLVGSSSRQVFLAFVAHGMSPQGWDSAVQTHYRYRSVEELEQAWMNHLRSTRRPPVQLAQTTRPMGGDAANRVVVRQTAPPVQPLLAPVVRGQNPGMDYDIEPVTATAPAVAGRPTYLPDYPPPAYQPAPAPAAPDRWQPAPGQTYQPPPVRLGPPQLMPPPGPTSPGYAPVGYPR